MLEYFIIRNCNIYLCDLEVIYLDYFFLIAHKIIFFKRISTGF